MTDLEEKMLAGVKETRTARKEVFKGSFLKVRCDTVTTATGVTRTREYIVHPGASVIVCLFDDQSVLMEYQWRQPLSLIHISEPTIPLSFSYDVFGW